MPDSIFAWILPVLTFIIGFLLNWLQQYVQEEQRRKERYDLELLPKRFEVYQEAYVYADKLPFKIHADEEKEQLVSYAKEWYTKNCLYLKPILRADFKKFIHQVWMHRDMVDHWKIIGQSENFETVEAIKLSKEIEDNFKEIHSMQKKIQEDIDQYYNNLE